MTALTHTPGTHRRLVTLLLNIAHGVDHMFLLIFATAVTTIALEFGLERWEDLMPYSALAFLLFGTALGTPVSIIAATTGAALAFALSRWWAHDAVLETFGHHPRLIVLRAWVGARGFESVLLARVAPGMPYNLVNYAAGLTPVAFWTFVAATGIGVAPRAFAYTALGGSIGRLGSPAAIVAICLLVAEGALGVWLLRRAGARPSSAYTERSSSPSA